MTVHRTDTAPTPESDETYVREVIDSAMSGSRPPLDLAAGALHRGRRLRTRRRLALASTAVAASVLAAVTAPLVLSGDDGSGTDGAGLIATQGPAPVLEAPRGWWDMPATEMVSTVQAILPDGVVLEDSGPLEADTPEGGPARGWAQPHLRTASGSGSLNVILYPSADPTITLTEDQQTVLAPSGPATDISCGEEREGRTRCTQIVDENGEVVGRRLTSRWGGTLMTEVVLRRDGGTVYAASANTLDDKWGEDSQLTATRPPLTLDQLEDLVRNDAWVSYRP